MKKKATLKVCTRSRFFDLVGLVGLLFTLVFIARADSSATGTNRLSAPTNPASEIFASDVIAAPKALPETPTPVLTEAKVNDSENGGAITPVLGPVKKEDTTESTGENLLSPEMAEFDIVGSVSNLNLRPSHEEATPVFTSSTFVLEESDWQSSDHPAPWAEFNLGWGHVLVRLFAPYSYPSPPGGQQSSELDESDRPWPVIAAGAATGNSWNEPSLYRAQGLLSLSW